MTKVFLIRHGETDWNKKMRYQGQTNIPLNEIGRQQARQLAVKLKKENFTAVYSSDLARANETALILAEPHNLQVFTCAGLKEINFGQWEGLTYDCIRGQWSEEMRHFFTQPSDVEIPDGESFQQVQYRMVASLMQLVKKHPDETVLVVSHGAAIRTAICAALDISLNQVWNIRQDNTALNILEYHSKKTVLACLNDTNHLEVE